MVWEVLLVNFRVVSVGGGPRQVSCVGDVQTVAELVVQIDADVAPYTGRHRALASTQHEVRWNTGFDRNRHIHKFTRRHVVGHTDNV